MPQAKYWQTFFNVEGILDQLLAIKKLSRILELGSGYGTFTLPLAEMGHEVIGLDIEPELVQELNQEVDQRGLKHIKASVRDFVAEGTGELDNSVDHVLLYNILHIENPVLLLQEAHRIIKNGGTASIIHWRSDIPTPRGPSLDIRPTAEQCSNWALEAGFKSATVVSLDNVAPYHYGVIIYK